MQFTIQPLNPPRVKEFDVTAEQLGFTPPPLRQTSIQTSIANEKGWHRAAAYMCAMGCTNKEIAAELGYSEGQVSNISRDPTWRAMVAQLIHEKAEGDILPMQRAAAVEALIVMRDLQNDPNVAAQVRQKAAADTLDRYFGKAQQNVNHIKSSNTIENDKEELLKLRERFTPQTNQPKLS